jgi:hypothetical protein
MPFCDWAVRRPLKEDGKDNTAPVYCYHFCAIVVNNKTLYIHRTMTNIFFLTEATHSNIHIHFLSTHMHRTSINCCLDKQPVKVTTSGWRCVVESPSRRGALRCDAPACGRAPPTRRSSRCPCDPRRAREGLRAPNAARGQASVHPRRGPPACAPTRAPPRQVPRRREGMPARLDARAGADHPVRRRGVVRRATGG